ncbi:MAG TPA: tetratricopeptide repeat protein [Pyrinomonadaceae bacterium]|nr:tetratricopeptide repeat protein [Pyrinomonadaceae bacterium]
MAQELIQINVRNPLVRVLLILLLLVAAAWSYFVVRWYLGNTFAEYFNTETNSLEAAQRAVSMGPNDPSTHWRMGQVLQKVFSLEQQTQTIAEYERAVSLSPNDYRYWTSLGTAYEQIGETAKAEHALKRAVELAPAYAYPRWYLGNLLVRNGRYDEAFAELRLASKAEPEFQPQVFNLAWQIHGDDAQAVKKAIGENSATRAQFAVYLIGMKQIDEGLKFWNEMSIDDRKANFASGESIIASLKNEHRYRDALKVWNDIVNERMRAEVGSVFDSSFEEAGSYELDTPFGWQVRSAPQVSIEIDADRSQTGGRSLHWIFQVRTNVGPVQIMQLVPVQPQTEYEFEGYVSTDKLESGSTPQIDIVDPVDEKTIVSSPAAPRATNNWNRINLTFKTGEKAEAVILRVVRNSCVSEQTPICPIFGSVWYDNFTIKRRN